jgi:hypothetical protein
MSVKFLSRLSLILKFAYPLIHWGHRVIVDQNNPEMVYITTFGSSVWHGFPETE